MNTIVVKQYRIVCFEKRYSNSNNKVGVFLLLDTPIGKRSFHEDSIDTVYFANPSGYEIHLAFFEGHYVYKLHFE